MVSYKLNKPSSESVEIFYVFEPYSFSSVGGGYGFIIIIQV